MKPGSRNWKEEEKHIETRAHFVDLPSGMLVTLEMLAEEFVLTVKFSTSREKAAYDISCR